MSNKRKLQQVPMFSAGEELPIFTGGVYGSGVEAFVAREEGKQGAMFRPSFGELAKAQMDKKQAEHDTKLGKCGCTRHQ